jgi:aspartate aminotransferase
VIAPQAAIYLTVKFELQGQVTKDGVPLKGTRDITKYLLDEAKLAIVPFYAFGASEDSHWYRISVGTCKVSDMDIIISNLRRALGKLSSVAASA